MPDLILWLEVTVITMGIGYLCAKKWERQRKQLILEDLCREEEELKRQAALIPPRPDAFNEMWGALTLIAEMVCPMGCGADFCSRKPIKEKCPSCIAGEVLIVTKLGMRKPSGG